MPDNDTILDESRKQQLDTNIRNMLNSGASNDDVVKYAQDFKIKFGTSKKKVEDSGISSKDGSQGTTLNSPLISNSAAKPKSSLIGLYPSALPTPETEQQKQDRHAKVANSSADALLTEYDDTISSIKGTHPVVNWKDAAINFKLPQGQTRQRLANVNQERKQQEGLYLQSREGKTGKIIKDVVNGEANVEDINYLKDAAPSAIKQLLASLLPTYNPSEPITDNDVKGLVQSVNVIKQDAIAANKVVFYSKLENQSMLDLSSAGAEFNEQGRFDSDQFLQKLQSNKQKEIQDLDAEYPLRQERIVAGNGRASMYVNRRENANEYNERVQKINEKYIKAHAALGTYASFEKAKANPYADPMQVGLEYLKHADPEAYKLRNLAGVDRPKEWGGGQATKDDYDIYQSGVVALYGTADAGNKNFLKILSQKEESSALLHPEKIKAETYQRLGAELYKNQSWFFNAAPSMEMIDEAAKQLPETNRKIYDLYIRPDEARRIGTKIPLSGALNKVGEQFTNTVFSAFKAFDPTRTDNIIGLDKINQDSDTQFMDVGTHPDAVNRIAQLNRKAVKEELTTDELNEKIDLEKFTGVRSYGQELIDGTAGLVGQVLAQAVGTKGLGSILGVGAESAGLLKAEQALTGLSTESAIANDAVNFGVSKATLNTIAADFTAVATSYDQAKQDAAALFPNAEDSGKRTLFATIVAGLNAGTERIFKDERILDAFNKEIAPSIKAVVSKLTNGEIGKEALQPELTKIMKNALSVGKYSIEEANKEALEELATSVGTSVATAILAPAKFSINDAYNDAVNTYTTMLTNGGALGLFAGIHQHRANKVGIPLLSQLGVNKDFTTDVLNEINKQQISGAITQDEANDKIRITKTAAIINTTTMPQVDKVNQLPVNARNKYGTLLLNESLLKHNAENTNDEVLKKELENRVSESEKVRQQIIKKEVFVDDDYSVRTPKEITESIKQKEIDNALPKPELPIIADTNINNAIPNADLPTLKALANNPALSKDEKKSLNEYIVKKEAFDEQPEELKIPISNQPTEQPKEEIVFPARDNDFANKFFNEQEMAAYQSAEPQVQKQMIADKKTELQSPKIVEPTLQGIDEEAITISEMIDKKGTYKGQRGTFVQEGQAIEFHTDKGNRIYELGNVDEIKNAPIDEYGIEQEQSVIQLNDNGTIVSREKIYTNPSAEEPLKAIQRNKDGQVVSVKLLNENGKPVTFRGQRADDLAYQLTLKEITKDENTTREFEKFINTDANAIEQINDAGLPSTSESEAVVNNEPVSKQKIERKNKSIKPATEVGGAINPSRHREVIQSKFRNEFEDKGIPKEQVEGAIAIMEARAKSWASEKKGRKADEWYQRIADVKGGEFENAESAQYQKANIAGLAAGVLSMIPATSSNTAQQNIQSKTEQVKEQPAIKDEPIKIVDSRKVDAASNTEVNDRNNMGSDSASTEVMKDIIHSSVKHGVDPYTALAIALQETSLEGYSDNEENPYHVLPEDLKYADAPAQTVDNATKWLKEKFDYGKKLGKKSEADIIQAFNGYGKVGKNTEGQQSKMYGIDVTNEPIDMNKNPVYGKRVIDLRDNVLKQNPAIVKLVEGERKNVAYQENDEIKRGAVETLEDGRKVIHALESPDFSTMVHEIAHVFEGDLNEAETAQVKEFGGSEAFARAFERYLRNGVAPSSEMMPLFDKFRNWLVDIYKSLIGSPVEKRVSPEIKEIFDSLLTEKNTNEQPSINTVETGVEGSGEVNDSNKQRQGSDRKQSEPGNQSSSRPAEEEILESEEKINAAPTNIGKDFSLAVRPLLLNNRSNDEIESILERGLTEKEKSFIEDEREKYKIANDISKSVVANWKKEINEGRAVSQAAISILPSILESSNALAELTNEFFEYTPDTQKEAYEYANKWVNFLGANGTLEYFLKEKSNIPPLYQTALLVKMIDRYKEDGDFKGEANSATLLRQHITYSAQGLQSAKAAYEWLNLTNSLEAQKVFVQNIVDEINNRVYDLPQVKRLIKSKERIRLKLTEALKENKELTKQVSKVVNEYIQEEKKSGTSVNRIKSKAKATADAVRRLKIKQDPNTLQSNIFGIFIPFVNTGLESIAVAIETGGNVIDAIESALNGIKKARPEFNLEKEFKEYVSDNIIIPTEHVHTSEYITQGVIKIIDDVVYNQVDYEEAVNQKFFYLSNFGQFTVRRLIKNELSKLHSTIVESVKEEVKEMETGAIDEAIDFVAGKIKNPDSEVKDVSVDFYLKNVAEKAGLTYVSRKDVLSLSTMLESASKLKGFQKAERIERVSNFLEQKDPLFRNNLVRSVMFLKNLASITFAAASLLTNKLQIVGNSVSNTMQDFFRTGKVDASYLELLFNSDARKKANSLGADILLRGGINLQQMDSVLNYSGSQIPSSRLEEYKIVTNKWYKKLYNILGQTFAGIGNRIANVTDSPATYRIATAELYQQIKNTIRQEHPDLKEKQVEQAAWASLNSTPLSDAIQQTDVEFTNRGYSVDGKYQTTPVLSYYDSARSTSGIVKTEVAKNINRNSTIYRRRVSELMDEKRDDIYEKELNMSLKIASDLLFKERIGDTFLKATPLTKIITNGVGGAVTSFTTMAVQGSKNIIDNIFRQNRIANMIADNAAFTMTGYVNAAGNIMERVLEADPRYAILKIVALQASKKGLTSLEKSYITKRQTQVATNAIMSAAIMTIAMSVAKMACGKDAIITKSSRADGDSVAGNMKICGHVIPAKFFPIQARLLEVYSGVINDPQVDDEIKKSVFLATWYGLTHLGWDFFETDASGFDSQITNTINTFASPTPSKSFREKEDEKTNAVRDETIQAWFQKMLAAGASNYIPISGTAIKQTASAINSMNNEGIKYFKPTGELNTNAFVNFFSGAGRQLANQIGYTNIMNAFGGGVPYLDYRGRTVDKDYESKKDVIDLYMGKYENQINMYSQTYSPIKENDEWRTMTDKEYIRYYSEAVGENNKWLQSHYSKKTQMYKEYIVKNKNKLEKNGSHIKTEDEYFVGKFKEFQAKNKKAIIVEQFGKEAISQD